MKILKTQNLQSEQKLCSDCEYFNLTEHKEEYQKPQKEKSVKTLLRENAEMEAFLRSKCKFSASCSPSDCN